MSRQRMRRIVVDGSPYRWRVRKIDAHWVSVRLWRDGAGTKLADVRVRFDDPWLLYPEMLAVAQRDPTRLDELFAREPLGSGRIADLIRACVARDRAHEDFELVDGDLRPVVEPVPEGRDSYEQRRVASATTMLSRWAGADARMVELTRSITALRIVLARPGHDGQLWVSCLDPVWICGPVRWHDSCLIVAVAAAPLIADEAFEVSDEAAGLRVRCGDVEVAEHETAHW